MRKAKTILLLLLLTLMGSAQNMDPARMVLYTNWDKTNQRMAWEEAAAISSQTYHHVWIAEELDKVTNLQRQFSEYLDSLHDVIAIAAQLYGSYYEFSQMATNLKNIASACEESPTNVLANAFKEDKRNIVTNIVTKTSDMLLDLRKIFFDKTKMTERERYILLDEVRRKMKETNLMLRRLERSIRYYSLCDLWNEVRNREYAFRQKTNGEIAREARDRWQDHYRPVFTDADYRH